MNDLNEFLEPALRINRDLLKLVKQGGESGIPTTEARFLVDLYYTMQKQRIALNNRISALRRDAAKAGVPAEPHSAFLWVFEQFEVLEEQVKKLLQAYTKGHEMAWFFDQTCGVGPVLAAGLLAHIDIHKAPTAGHIWSFAGLVDGVKWKRGQRRPWNAALKTICWKIGDSFVKASTKPSDFYGKLYRQRKELEWANNLSGELISQADKSMMEHPGQDDTDRRLWLEGRCNPAKARAMLEKGLTPTAAACRADTLTAGLSMLPPAHIDARARRYTVKLFLSHLQQCWWEQATGTKPPAPYVFSHMGHGHFIAPPQVKPV